MPQAKLSQPQAYLIRALIIGTLLLFTGLALGLKLRAPKTDKQAVVETNAPSFDHARADVASTDLRISPTEMPSTHDTAASEQPVENYHFHAATFTSADNTADTEASDADFGDESDSTTASRRQELQYLQEVHPHNLMIPLDKSPPQLDALWSEFQRYNALQQRIDAGTASEQDREQYYTIRMAKYEEEKALIELCNDVAVNAPTDPDSEQATLCTHMSAASAERLQVIEASIAELEQQLLYSASLD